MVSSSARYASVIVKRGVEKNARVVLPPVFPLRGNECNELGEEDIGGEDEVEAEVQERYVERHGRNGIVD